MTLTYTLSHAALQSVIITGVIFVTSLVGITPDPGAFFGFQLLSLIFAIKLFLFLAFEIFTQLPDSIQRQMLSALLTSLIISVLGAITGYPIQWYLIFMLLFTVDIFSRLVLWDVRRVRYDAV